MIKSKEEYLFYLKADAFARGLRIDSVSKLKRSFLYKDSIWLFHRRLRKAEYIYNCKRNTLLGKLRYTLANRRLRRISLKLGFSIPINVFGPGLSIAHYGTIIVNGSCKIGKNCKLQACINIGASGGNPQAPVIGDNCYIGPGAKLFGPIELGNNITVGANAVVNKSFPQNDAALLGIPAKAKCNYSNFKIVARASEAVEYDITLYDYQGVAELNQLIRSKQENDSK